MEAIRIGTSRLQRGCWLIGALMLLSCGAERDRGVFDAYDDANVAVIGDHIITLSGPVEDGDCVRIAESTCISVARQGARCERNGGPVDVVVVDGVAVTVVCYPPAQDADRPTVVIDATTEGDLEIMQNANDTTVVFAAERDGVPFAGNLDVDGNNVAIYGNGPDKTIIDGDVTISGNNVRLRGVTITGNVNVVLNDAAIVLCHILGDVLVAKNGTVLVENDIHGALTSTSNGNVFVGNDVQGSWGVGGNGLTCDENNAFADGNTNYVIDDGEVREPVACP